MWRPGQIDHDESLVDARDKRSSHDCTPAIQHARLVHPRFKPQRKHVAMIKPFAVSCLVVIASAASAQEVATPSSGSTQSPAAARPAGEVAYDKDDILVAADQAFGKGTAGLADVVERIFSDLGRPNAYIVGSTLR